MSRERGVSLIETLAVTTILAILVMLAVPSFQGYRSSLRMTQEITEIARTLAELRAESLRRRSTTTLTFSSAGFSWDTAGDAAPTNGTFLLQTGVEWDGNTPQPFSFNGLGLARNIGPENLYILSVKQGSTTKGLLVNGNGYITVR